MRVLRVVVVVVLVVLDGWSDRAMSSLLSQDTKRGREEGCGGAGLQDDTAVALSGLLSISLTLGIWLGQSLSGN